MRATRIWVKFLRDHGGSASGCDSGSREVSSKQDLKPPTDQAAQQYDWLEEQRGLANARDPNPREREQDGIQSGPCVAPGCAACQCGNRIRRRLNAVAESSKGSK